jgi:hypothetical protein
VRGHRACGRFLAASLLVLALLVVLAFLLTGVYVLLFPGEVKP